MSWLPAPVEELFGAEATVEEAYDLLTVDVPAAEWIAALKTARTTLECTYFDWLSAVDEPESGFRVCAHVAAVAPGSVRRLLLRTTVPHTAPVLASAVEVYAGAAWHERETHEMFGVDFTDHPGLDPLLLPDGFEGHPLRKDFVLAARVAKAWPGAKEPGESEHGGPKRRQMLPPGVPDPNEWGPLKGQLPPAPARPARGARAAGAGAAGRAAGAAGSAGAGGRAAGERPARRTRSASEGSASQAPAVPEVSAVPEASAAPAAEGEPTSAPQAPASQAPAPQDPAPRAPEPAPEAPARPARRSRSASQGSASQRATPPAEPQAPTPEPEPAPKPRSSDAPWHHAKPAFDDESKKPEPTPTPDENSTDTTDTTDSTDTNGGNE
ncbi:NADH-quinone oxidoreductase subunit C [Streptomyces sp. KL109B]|uniref:NADH-quinone oxidoreductase subunit C n=2 Tax=unclassified Streptomyces TaxID=2593676 RepID=UPI00278BC635|nr:NADH-quinone oxidoreductase subunit C [Streptomyces sp. KL109B]